LPSRITVASGASPFLSAASALEALRSFKIKDSPMSLFDFWL
jgi:hypothetical protein